MSEIGDSGKILLDNNIIINHSPKAIFELDKKNNTTVKDSTKTEYHNQRLGQSRWAFRLSIWSSIVGFIVIILSLYQGLKIGNLQWPGIVLGVIIEGVSALFYALTNKANDKISEFFKELTKDSNIEQAIRLADQIDDSQIRNELKVKLSLYLTGINEDKICKNTRDICKND